MCKYVPDKETDYKKLIYDTKFILRLNDCFMLESSNVTYSCLDDKLN